MCGWSLGLSNSLADRCDSNRKLKLATLIVRLQALLIYKFKSGIGFLTALQGREG